MSYRTENEFQNFDFSEAVVCDVEGYGQTLRFCLDNVKIKPENSKNRDIRLMRTNGLIVSFSGVTIKELVKEGLKYYDANGKLMREDADSPVSENQVEKMREVFPEGSVYSFSKDENTFTMSVDASDEFPYDLVFEADSDIEEWERFMNLE